MHEYTEYTDVTAESAEDTGDNTSNTPPYILLSKGVVVRLHQAKPEGGGISVPKFETITHSSGRQASLQAEAQYLLKATVHKLPAYHGLYTREDTNLRSYELLEEGDTVLLAKEAINPRYAFFEKRETSVLENEDLLLLPYHLIEAIHDKLPYPK